MNLSMFIKIIFYISHFAGYRSTCMRFLSFRICPARAMSFLLLSLLPCCLHSRTLSGQTKDIQRYKNNM